MLHARVCCSYALCVGELSCRCVHMVSANDAAMIKGNDVAILSPCLLESKMAKPKIASCVSTFQRWETKGKKDK